MTSRHTVMNCIACAAIAIAATGTGRPAVGAALQEVTPATTAYGTRGLSQTASAQALGAGRLNVVLQGTWYKQKDFFPGTPDAGVGVATGSGAIAFGVSNYFDVFGSVNFFDLMKYTGADKSGPGTATAGIQASLPLPKNSPVFLGLQGIVLGGFSKNQINTNKADGYNYFETSTEYQIMGKVLESVVFGTGDAGLQIHLNEGAAQSADHGADALLLLSGGIQGNIIPALALGVEANSRTFYKNRAFTSDPLWVSPSIIVRTPVFLSFTLGCDISAAKKRINDPAQRSLESYRVFGNAVISYDCLANTRNAAARAAAEKAKYDSTERAMCLNDAKRCHANRDSLKQKANADALRNQHSMDSVQTVLATLMKKAQADSARNVELMAEAKRLLAIEKEHRSDLEKKLLTTGMLILDAVYFESGKTEISMNSKPYLKIIGKMLVRYPKLMLEVGGHTDNRGVAEKNQQLSQARADAVRSYLIEVAPDLYSRLSAMGYGQSVPKEDNRTAAGRKVNRRVEIRVLNPDALKEYN